MNTSQKSNEFSAGRGLAIGFGGAAVLIAGVISWSVMASVSGAVIASGKVEVEGRNQPIEHIDGGTVDEIFVSDGDRVEVNQVLLRFSDKALITEKALLLGQYVEYAARRNRLEAEFHGESSITWDQNLIELANSNPDFKKVLDGQESYFHARIAARDGEVSRINEQIGQSRNEIAGLESRTESLRQQRSLVVQELEAERTLFDQGLTRLPRLLAVERAAENLEGLVASNNAQIARIQGTIAELEIQILLVDLRRVEVAEQAATEVNAQENQIKERLDALEEQLNRLEIRSPVAGVVFDTEVFSSQEVVFPGEPILHIVPDDARLVVLAQVQLIDVDQVRPGQEAILRFSAFPARETPEFSGSVKRISADAVLDEVTGASFYEVELTLDKLLNYDNEEIFVDSTRGESTLRTVGHLTVTPGMPVEVHIRTTERTVVSYLIKPVTDFFYRSLREE